MCWMRYSTPEFELNHPTLPPGIEGVKTIVKMNNDAFDDWHFEVHDLISDGDKNCCPLHW